jgi:hypothetical protein
MREAALQFTCMQSRFGGQLGTERTFLGDRALAQDMDGWCHMRMVLKIMHTFLIDVTFMLLGHYAVHLANIHKYITVSIICERRSN